MASIREILLSFYSLLPSVQMRDINILYDILYNHVHDLNESLALTASQTEGAFDRQWREMPSGHALLSDVWFKENVARILAEEEIQIRPDWFAGKRVLDAGCGNGRWSYGFAQMGADVTAIDINQSGLDQTDIALRPFDVKKRFIRSSLENLPDALKGERFDLVFCWGVLHHCRSFTRSLDNLITSLEEDGVLYLYLYGRESMPYSIDRELFKRRLLYNNLRSDEEKYKYLLSYVKGDVEKVHNAHDIFAPLINRRFEYSDICHILQTRGFNDITRTILHTELFIRSKRNYSEEFNKNWVLPQKMPPYWFERYKNL